MPRCASATPISPAATRRSAIATRPAPNGSWSKAGEIAVDGGWRIYSSGPGVYVSLVVQHALGVKRRFGKRRRAKRALPASQRRLQLAGIPPRR